MLRHDYVCVKVLAALVQARFVSGPAFMRAVKCRIISAPLDAAFQGWSGMKPETAPHPLQGRLADSLAFVNRSGRARVPLVP